MKIVMNEAGRIVATHADTFAVPDGAYAGYGWTFVGVVDDADVVLTEAGDYVFVGNVKALDVAKDLAGQMVRTAADALADAHLSRYPRAEIESWPMKLAEAREILAGADGSTSMLIKPIAEASGATLQAVAQAVVDKAAEFAGIAAQAEIMRTTGAAKIKAAKTLTGVRNAVEAAIG